MRLHQDGKPLSSDPRARADALRISIGVALAASGAAANRLLCAFMGNDLPAVLHRGGLWWEQQPKVPPGTGHLPSPPRSGETRDLEI